MDSFYKNITLLTNNNNISMIIYDKWTIFCYCFLSALGIMSHVEVSGIYKKTTKFYKLYVIIG